MTIEGNLFKVNGGNGIESAVAVEAQYYCGGDPAGAAGPLGDHASALVDASNPTYVEYWIDIQPDTNPAERRLAEGATFNVALKADAKLLNEADFPIHLPCGTDAGDTHLHLPAGRPPVRRSQCRRRLRTLWPTAAR